MKYLTARAGESRFAGGQSTSVTEISRDSAFRESISEFKSLFSPKKIRLYPKSPLSAEVVRVVVSDPKNDYSPKYRSSSYVILDVKRDGKKPTENDTGRQGRALKNPPKR